MPTDETTLRPLRPEVKDKEQLKPSSPVCYADSSEVRKEFLDEETSKNIDGGSRVGKD